VTVARTGEADEARARARETERAEMMERARLTMDAFARPPRRHEPWKKGKAPKGGITKVYALARRVLIDHKLELVDLVLNCPDEKVRAACLIASLDRAGVKPMEFDPKVHEERVKPPFDPSGARSRRRAGPHQRQLL